MKGRWRRASRYPRVPSPMGLGATLNLATDRLPFAIMSTCFACEHAASVRRCVFGLSIFTALALPALGTVGCQSKGDPSRRVSRSVEGVPDEPWVLGPVTMRVYPSTRFVKESHQSLLEARVEPLDEMGDSVKAVGRFRLELFDPVRKREINIGQQLYRWDVPMWTLDQQRQCYDPVTRAYKFRLAMDDTPQALGQPMILRVTFLSGDGLRLEAQATIKP